MIYMQRVNEYNGCNSGVRLVGVYCKVQAGEGMHTGVVVAAVVVFGCDRTSLRKLHYPTSDTNLYG